MRRGLPALLVLLASQAGAQSFVSMGRLFTTPSERAQLDAQRNQAPLAGAAAPGAAHGALPGVAAAPPMPAAPAAAGPGAMGDPGAAGAGVTAAAGATAGAGQTPSGAVPAAVEPGLRLDGVIRRPHGRTMVIVNGEVQPAPPGGVARGTVRLQADGRSVVLKPGQRYDPATGEIHEAAR